MKQQPPFVLQEYCDICGGERRGGWTLDGTMYCSSRACERIAHKRLSRERAVREIRGQSFFGSSVRIADMDLGK